MPEWIWPFSSSKELLVEWFFSQTLYFGCQYCPGVQPHQNSQLCIFSVLTAEVRYWNNHNWWKNHGLRTTLALTQTLALASFSIRYNYRTNSFLAEEKNASGLVARHAETAGIDKNNVMMTLRHHCSNLIIPWLGKSALHTVFHFTTLFTLFLVLCGLKIFWGIDTHAAHCHMTLSLSCQSNNAKRNNKKYYRYTNDCVIVQGGLRRGGLTPALAPRMPVITEDVGKSRR